MSMVQMFLELIFVTLMVLLFISWRILKRYESVIDDLGDGAKKAHDAARTHYRKRHPDTTTGQLPTLGPISQ